jgi:hypothetical protein
MQREVGKHRAARKVTLPHCIFTNHCHVLPIPVALTVTSALSRCAQPQSGWVARSAIRHWLVQLFQYSHQLYPYSLLVINTIIAKLQYLHSSEQGGSSLNQLICLLLSRMQAINFKQNFAQLSDPLHLTLLAHNSQTKKLRAALETRAG